MLSHELLENYYICYGRIFLSRKLKIRGKIASLAENQNAD